MLVVTSGRDSGKAVALGEQTVSIGSGEECELVVGDRTVSRRHLTARADGADAVLTDLGSRNGSWFEGARFSEITVGFGAAVRIGHTELKYVPGEQAVEPEPAGGERFGALFGSSVPMRKLFTLLAELAKHDTTVLVEGETGTGKELVAEEIHNHSARRDGPFVVFDCGAVARELAASALFGHVRGAFTGATTDRKGAFAEAHGGTIFLDEIGELPLELQPSLLRAIDKKAVSRIGTNTYEKVDVRIVAATHRDLRHEVAERRFREDLYYRLAVVRLRLPPLRERGDDIALLARHFLAGKNVTLSPEDEAQLLAHPWPGNVRELRNVLERVQVLSAQGAWRMDMAVGESALESSPTAYKDAKREALEKFDRGYLEALMERHAMNLSSAAREAGVDRKYLRELLDRYGIRRG